MPATNKRFSIRAATILELEAGKIKRHLCGRAACHDEQGIEVAAFEESWHVRGKLGHAADYLRISAFAPAALPLIHYLCRRPARTVG